MNNNIRVGIDGSECSRAALRWSASRITVSGAASRGTVTLVHVVDDDWGMMGSRNMEALREDGRALAAREAKYARSLAPDLGFEIEVRLGNPMWELIATSAGAVMTVVGTHKTGFIQGRIFGSRSLQLAAAARSHVAVIPQSFPHDGRGVVVGVDDTRAGQAALCFGAEEAKRTQQPLVLVRASRPSKHVNEGDSSAADDQEHAARNALRQLSAAEAAARSIFPTGDMRSRHVHRPPAEALLDASGQASLLVIGGSRRTGEDRMVLGSVSHDVLLNLAGPTIVVHGGERP
jgi:nucleotide-binding universal stress UspA family protein